MSRQVRHDGVSELGGAADALTGEQRKQSIRVVLRNLALLPFLDRPCSLADVVNSITKIHQNTLVNSAGPDRMLKLKKLRARLFQLKVDTPERLTRDQQLDSSPDHAPLLAANADDPRPVRFS